MCIHAEWVEAQLEQEEGMDLLAARLNEQSRRAREWQRQARRRRQR